MSIIKQLHPPIDSSSLVFRRSSLRHIILLLACVVALTASTFPFNVFGQVQLDRFYPPVVSRLGESAVVKAEGNFPNWPVDLICDRADVLVTAGSELGEVEVQLESGSHQGVAWVRAADSQSVSAPVPLLIEPFVIRAETEPNDHASTAQEIQLPSCLAGRLAKSNDVDTYRVKLERGQLLVVSVIAHEVLRSPMDAVLQICDIKGNVLLQSDDERGLDPQLVYESPDDCERLVRLFAFPETPNSTIGFSGGANFVYLIRMTTSPIVDHVLPLFAGSARDEESVSMSFRSFGWNLDTEPVPSVEPATDVSPAMVQDPEHAGWQWLPSLAGTDLSKGMSKYRSYFESPAGDVRATGSLPICCSGHISVPGEIDCFRFRLRKGVPVRAQVHSRRFGFQLDSVLRVVEPSTGKVLSSNDDRARRDYDASLDYTAVEDGEVELQISDLADSASPRHAYSVIVAEVTPTVSMRSASDVFTVDAGKQIEIPVTIDRRDGYSKQLEVRAAGLPESVSCEPVLSEAKGDSSKSIVLKLSVSRETKPQRFSFQIKASETNPEQAAAENIGGVEPVMLEPKSTSCEFELRPNVSFEKFWLNVKPAEKAVES